MKKPLLISAVVLFVYVLIYFTGKPLALTNPVASKIWATVFHPLRLITFRELHTGARTERGTIRHNTDGEWSLIYQHPKQESLDGTLTHGIRIHIPSSLLPSASAATGTLVEATITKEPDPERFNCARFVLHDFRPLPQ